MSKTWFSLKHRSQMCYALNGTELSRKRNSTQLNSNPTIDHGNTSTINHWKSINQMTIIFFKVNVDTFILRKINHDSTTESLDVKLEAVESGIQTMFKCPKGSEHYSFLEDLYKKPSTSRNQKPETNYLNG